MKSRSSSSGKEGEGRGREEDRERIENIWSGIGNVSASVVGPFFWLPLMTRRGTRGCPENLASDSRIQTKETKDVFTHKARSTGHQISNYNGSGRYIEQFFLNYVWERKIDC